MVKFRKPARKLYYRRRHYALTTNNALKSQKYKKILIVLIYILKNTSQAVEMYNKLILAARITVAYYLYLVLEPDYYLEKPIHLDRTIESFTESECRINFHFCKADLRRLFDLLQFPNWIHFENRSKMKGEEVFLRGLYELASGENQQKISANVFGTEGSTQSRAFSAFINHIYSNFHHLVHDNLDWWKRNGFFESSAAAILGKIGNIDVYIGDAAVAHFIDCNCMPTSVTGGGPAEAGANAARWDDAIQRAFYNGWKSVHGLKHQTVNNAYGFTVDMCGPTSLRHNDLYVLRESNINARMAELQIDDDFDYIIS